MASDDERFTVENNTIITTKDEVSVQHVFNFLSKNLEKFRVESRFMVVCGVHGSPEGQLKEYDEDFRYDYEMMYRWFNNHKKYSLQAKIVDDRQYHMGTVLELFSKEDETKPGKFSLTEISKQAIKAEFERILTLGKPIVLILASCWSFQSEISNILRSSGLYSALNLSEDRGMISSGKLFLLDPDQQEFLRTIMNDLEIKDVIIGGECLIYNIGQNML